MASNVILDGIVTEKDITLDGSASGGDANCGYIQSQNSNWTAAKAGPASDTGRVDETLVIGASGISTYTLRRSWLQFEIPFYPNVSRIDLVPQLKLRCTAKSGDGKVSIASCAQGSVVSPWEDGEADRDWDDVQIAASALYGQSAFETFSVAGSYVTINLNDLARLDCMNKRYILICLLDYTYDFLNATPGGSVTNNIELHDSSDANPPLLVLRKPWFVDKQGNEYPVDTDFTIRAAEIGVNQRNRAVQQLPFSTVVPGPAAMRFRNSVYQVTKG